MHPFASQRCRQPHLQLAAEVVQATVALPALSIAVSGGALGLLTNLQAGPLHECLELGSNSREASSTLHTVLCGNLSEYLWGVWGQRHTWDRMRHVTNFDPPLHS